MSNTVFVENAYRPFRWEDNSLYAYFPKLDAWYPIVATKKKNKHGDKVFRRKRSDA